MSFLKTTEIEYNFDKQRWEFIYKYENSKTRAFYITENMLLDEKYLTSCFKKILELIKNETCKTPKN